MICLAEQSIEDSPLDFGIAHMGGLRTTEDQQKLYAKGRTEPGKIVTHVDGVNRKSKHQARDNGYGYAFDIIVYKNGKLTWDHDDFELVARHILEVADALGYNVEWGGDWKWKDMPHFQLMD